MLNSKPKLRSLDPSVPSLTSYILDLEVEVDRLRQHSRMLQDEVRERLVECKKRGAGDSGEVYQHTFNEILAMLDLARELPEYHPADDRVVSIEIGPLAEKLFQYYQRQSNAASVELKLSLDENSIKWFPSRLHHILDNLFSNALKYRDRDKAEMRIHLQFETADKEWYCLRLTDNGCGMGETYLESVDDVSSRAVFHRRSKPGVGLAVVKRLVEQSGGAISLTSDVKIGTVIDMILPRFDLEDYLT